MQGFECNECGEDFEAEWDFGGDVQCPHCSARFETDFDESWDGIQGPWLSKVIAR